MDCASMRSVGICLFERIPFTMIERIFLQISAHLKDAVMAFWTPLPVSGEMTNALC